MHSSKSQSYWRWFYIILCVISAADYIEHISRKGIFFENKGGWLLFTFSSTAALIGVTAIVNTLFVKVFKAENVFLQSGAIASGIACHTILTGPIFNQLFFPQSILSFYWNWITLVVVLGIFFVIRVLVYVLETRRLKVEK
jgi:hypothetical protein